MAEVVTNACIDALAQWALGIRTGFDPVLYLGLYVNNVQPVVNATVAYLGECTAPGYGRQLLAGQFWSGHTVNGISDYFWSIFRTTLTGPGSPPQTVYGHFVIEQATQAVWWSKRWDMPWPIPPIVTENVGIAPHWAGQQCIPPAP